MQTNEETQLDQQVPSEGSPSASTPTASTPAAPASKKKASKKKASKKKASKKKASKKKASKKKASKKKRSKKKASSKAAGVEGDMAQVIAAVDQLRDAVYELASHQINQRKQLVEELRSAARSGFTEVETAARKTLNRLTGKG